MNIILNIFLGAIGSIVATIILYSLSQLYKFKYKARFKFNLELAKTATYQIQNQHLFPEDYTLVIGQIDVLYKCAFEMYESLYPLSLFYKPNVKKLIITLLYDIMRICEVSKFTTVGYSGLDEKEARLKQIHKYFYKYVALEESNCSTVIVQLNIIEDLIKGKPFIKSIKNGFGILADKTPLEDLVVDGFIHINSFKSNHNNPMQKRCFKNDEFERILRKHIK